MEFLLPLLLGLLLGTALGVLIGILLTRARIAATARDNPLAGAPEDPAIVQLRHAAELSQLRAEEAGIRSELTAHLAGIQATAAALTNQVTAQQTQHRELLERHDAEQRVAAERERTEGKVLQALTPVQESLRSMQLKVTELEAQRSLQHGELSQQLRNSVESEERLRTTAESLASALRNNATRGVWGETQLRRVVEAAGLIERVDFDVQSSISSDAGVGRPDMIVYLPGGKSIAVDAKVPFNAYIEASAIPAASSTAELARRDQLMKQHVKALRDHITTLGTKAYWQGLDASPELVIAFIPTESLVSSAIEADPSLMEFAFSRGVALASPITLWSTLKTVAVSWQHHVVTQEAKQLFDLSRELYGRLAVLASHVEKLGRSIEGTVKHYNAFVGSLERQVLPSARKLNMLDETKVLPVLGEIDDIPRELTAWELTTALDAERA
ncbi:MAG: DNA recombination protein RmuC [Microbacteriaceae bacterium]|nr:DNA recombination protein RmuC [Microbacteriaceae bacterium]